MRLFETLVYVFSVIFVACYIFAIGMMLFQDKGRRTLELALRSLWLHKMRAMLSVLGIIIGTSAVIALLSFGEGSMQDALEDIKRLGATNIIVRSVKPPEELSTQSRSFVARYGITVDDFEKFKTIPSVIRMVPIRSFSKPVYHDQFMFNSNIVATTPEYKDINKIEEKAGRFLVKSDSDEQKNVCILGSDVAAALFPFGNAIEQSILIDKFSYVVVGVAESRNPISSGNPNQMAINPNTDVYIPLGTADGRFGKTVFLRQSGTRSGEQVQFSQITMTVAETDEVRRTGESIKAVLSDHRSKDTILEVPLDKLEEAERAKDRFLMLLAMIGFISLVVGGIGIMNIMLATVTERTREIGIRRALGAKRSDITMQFLIEAVVQTTIGGLMGVACGLLIIYTVPPLFRHFFNANVPAKLHVLSIFLSLASAVSIGVLFGWYPARRASVLDPIEALRHV